MLEIANFDLRFDPRELEYDVRMGNRSGYKGILKLILVYQKPQKN